MDDILVSRGEWIMIHSLATRIASIFVLYGESDEENADIYTYACEAVLSFLANLIVCLAIAFVFGRFIEGLVFISGFALLRRYTGGHHAKTHLYCILTFSGIVICTMILLTLAYWLQISGFIAVVVATVALIGIVLLAPVKHKNKVSGIEFQGALKRKSRWMAFAFWLFCILGFYMLNNQIVFVLSLSMFFVFGSMAYATIFNKEV